MYFKKDKFEKSVLYKNLFLYFFILFSDFVFAENCKEAFPNSESRDKKIEFSHFQIKPARRIIYETNLRNRWLSFWESRPDIYNEESYTAWLIDKQKFGEIPDAPYGYGIKEEYMPTGPFTVDIYFHHKTVPREVPAWLGGGIKLPEQDSTIWRKYVNWAENYYSKSRFYPPGYLQNMNNALAGVFFSGPPFTGFQDTRRLKDVMYSLGGKSQNKERSQPAQMLKLIKELEGGDRWLDGGTGAGFVLQDALTWIIEEKGIDSLEDIPDVLGISYNRINPEDFNPAVFPLLFAGRSSSYPVQLPQEILTKYKTLNDRLFSNIPIQELMPPFKLITDFFGIYTYSNDPSFVISKYLRVMSPEGALVIVYNDKDFVRIETKIMPFHNWLESVAGNNLSIEYGKGWVTSPGSKQEAGETAYMLIRNSSGDPVKLPSLTLVEYRNAQRVFRPSADIINSF